MSRHFPGWLRRIEPILAAEDTNPLFEAVRERARSRTGIKRMSRNSAAFNQQFLSIKQLGAIYLTFPAYILAALTLGLASGWLMALRRIASRPMKSDSLEFPTGIGWIAEILVYAEKPAIDIWLTGASGWHVAEAIYLETRRPWKPLFILMVPVYLVSCVCIAWALLGTASPSILWLATTGLGILVLGDAIFRVARVGVGTQTLVLDSSIQGWHDAAMSLFPWPVRKQSGFRMWLRRLAKMLYPGPLAWMLFSMLGLIVFVVVAGILAIAPFLKSGTPLPSPEIEPWSVPFCAIGGALAIHLVRRATRMSPERQARRERERRAMADYAFNLFMTVYVLRDSDGARWAREAHPEGARLFDERRF